MYFDVCIIWCIVRNNENLKKSRGSNFSILDNYNNYIILI